MRSAPGLATVLSNTQVVMVALAAWAIWGERPSGGRRWRRGGAGGGRPDLGSRRSAAYGARPRPGSSSGASPASPTPPTSCSCARAAATAARRGRCATRPRRVRSPASSRASHWAISTSCPGGEQRGGSCCSHDLSGGRLLLISASSPAAGGADGDHSDPAAGRHGGVLGDHPGRVALGVADRGRDGDPRSRLGASSGKRGTPGGGGGSRGTGFPGSQLDQSRRKNRPTVQSGDDAQLAAREWQLVEVVGAGQPPDREAAQPDPLEHLGDALVTAERGGLASMRVAVGPQGRPRTSAARSARAVSPGAARGGRWADPRARAWPRSATPRHRPAPRHPRAA